MKRNIKLLAAHNFLNDLRFQEAFLVIYFQQITGSYTVAMTVLAFTMLFSAFFEIPTGILSDRIGRRNALIVGSIVSTLGIALYAFAQDAVLLFAAALCAGLARAFFSGNNDALLYETLKQEGRENEFHHYLGRTNGMYQAGLSLSALCASLIVTDDLRILFVLGVIPQALSIVLSFFFVEPPPRVHTAHSNFQHFATALRKIWHNPKLRLFTFAQALSHGYGEATFNYKPVFVALLWPIWAIALYRGLNHICGFIGFWFAGAIIKRFKHAAVIVAMEVYGLVSQSLAVIISNVMTPILFLSGALSYGPFTVARDELYQREFSDEQRATMGSITSLAASIMFGLVAILLGLLSDNFGIVTALSVGIALGALTIPLYLFFFKRIWV